MRFCIARAQTGGYKPGRMLIMFKKHFAIVILARLFLFAPTSFGQTTSDAHLCQDWLTRYHASSASITNHQVDRTYVVHQLGTTKVNEWVFIRREVDSALGEAKLVFEEIPTTELARPTIHRLREQDVFVGDPDHTLSRATQNNHDSRLLNVAAFYKHHLNLVTKKRYVLDRSRNVVVTTNKRPSQATSLVAQDFIKNIEALDRRLLDMGFELPSVTQVHIAEYSWLPTSYGSYAYSVPIFNLFEGRMLTHIHMEDYGDSEFRGRIAHSISGALHERTHTVLFQQYNHQSHVIRNFNLQEALADYLSADTLDDPHIAPNIISSTTPFRDISQRDFVRWHEADLSYFKIASLAQLSENPSHANSLLYSNVLWNLRVALGPDAVRALIEPLIRHLNQNHASFLDRFQRLNAPNGRVEQIRDFEYFLANLGAISKQHKDTRIANVVSDTIANLHMNRQQVLAIQEALSSDGSLWLADPSDTTRYNVQVYLLTTAPITVPALVASLAYGVQQTLIWFLSDEDPDDSPPSDVEAP